MGKTASGAVWLDPNATLLTISTSTGAMGRCGRARGIRMLTFLPPLEEIEAMDNWEGAQLNKAKEILAYELTGLLYTARRGGRKRHRPLPRRSSPGWCGCHMPTTTLTDADFTDGQIGADVAREVRPSRPPTVRRASCRAAAYRYGEKVADFKQQLTKDFFLTRSDDQEGQKDFP